MSNGRRAETVAESIGGPYSVKVALSGVACPVRLENGQTIWFQIDFGDEIEQRRRQVKVVDKPWRSEAGTVMTRLLRECGALEDEKVVKKVPTLISFLRLLQQQFSPSGHGIEKGLSEEVLTRLGASKDGTKLLREAGLEEISNAVFDGSVSQAFRSVETLLRQYRPNFDELSSDEQTALIEHQCRRIHKALKACRGVLDYAEYGTLEGEVSPMVKKAAVDVRAAFLRDVEGLTNEQIAVRIGEHRRSEASEDKNDFPKTRQSVKRGRRLCERAYGKDGWANLINILG